MKYRACRKCKILTEEDKCPICGSTDLTVHWEGIVAVMDPMTSDVAKALGITRPGIYCLRVIE